MSEWRLQAACRGLDPELFFPHRAEVAELRSALEVCSVCPVQDECLQWALDNSEREGVWGGLPASSRRRVRSETLAKDRVVVCTVCGSEFLGHVRSKICSDHCRSMRKHVVGAQYRARKGSAA